MTRLAVCLLTAALLGAPLAAGHALAAPSASAKNDSLSERRKQKNQAQEERQALQQKLAAVKRDINQTEAAKDSAADELAQTEDAVSQANASLQELAQDQQGVESRLRKLAAEQKKLQADVHARQQKLARWLREQYIAGNEDRIKLLLSGDNPSRINRELQYMSYLSQAQARLLEELKLSLAEVERNKQETEQARAELQEIAEEERTQKQLLEQEKQRRAQLLGQLAQRLKTQKKQAGDLEKDEQRLGGLVEKLGQLIEEQRKAEEAAEKRRREAEREKQRQLALQKQREKSAKASATGKASAGVKPDTPKAAPEAAAETLPRSGPTLEAVAEGAPQNANFSSMRGQLRLPLRGNLVAKFGAKRGDGPSAKGIFIRAAEGEAVRAVASGRVVFAEWLRGFGNLIIVDHGAQYMSIYGNNQTLYKRAGDVVKSGDQLAAAGNSGGGEETGLYFELRHQGRAFDPLTWVK
ncbi:peptidoglycan DD-metalloendopeptidase family protein [Massilia sp. W12]|uniref:murein hydrolase activator EnvC family protein n=1 Tax=Massilia sp. W12 TaxID=3126507 RepID=UPI0030CFC039